MDSQPIRIDDESKQAEVANWTDAEEKSLIDLMIHQVKANNRPTSTFNYEGWKYIVENFNKINNRNYHRMQFKNKYNQLRKKHSDYYALVGHPGVSIDPVTKKPIANVDVWEMLYAKHKFSRQIRKKGCPFLDELDFVFSGISGNEDLPIGNSENPSNDEVKHVPETSDPHGTWAQNTAAIDENKLIESATWTNAEVKSFIELMVHQVKANNRPTSTFNTDGWKYIMENFNRINKKNYNKEQFKNKYHQLKTTHSNYYTIAGHAGVSIDPVTKKLKASTDVWESLYAKYKWAKKIRKKGCPYLDELDFIFLGTNASGDFAFGNNEDPSDDEIKHVPETLDPRGTWTQNTNANESAAEISQTDFIDESNERHTRKNNLLSLMRKSKKPRQSSKMMFAMQAWAEASKNKSKLYEMQLAEIKEARRQMQAQVEKRDTSVTKCMEVVNDIHAQHGLRIQQVKAATELFEKEHWRETFLGMSRDLQVAWLQDLQG